MRVLSKCLIVAASVATLTLPASAAPIAAPSGLQAAVAAAGEAQVQTVQWRRGGGWRGGGRWIGPAVVGGAIIGGAIAATRPYGYYGYGPGYYDNYAYGSGYSYGPGAYSGYAYVPSQRGYVARDEDDDVSYCEQRFRSYDRSSGTYMGYDGRRHPCP